MPVQTARITCRDYRPEDREACLDIIRSLTPMHFKPGEEDDFTEFLDNAGDGRHRYAVIENEDGQIIACGGMMFDPEKGVATLLWDMVRTDHQRQGIGKFMLAARMGWLSAHPEVNHVLATMSRHSAGFFEKEGFTTFHVERDYFGPGVDLYDMKFKVK